MVRLSVSNARYKYPLAKYSSTMRTQQLGNNLQFDQIHQCQNLFIVTAVRLIREIIKIPCLHK